MSVFANPKLYPFSLCVCGVPGRFRLLVAPLYGKRAGKGRAKKKTNFFHVFLFVSRCAYVRNLIEEEEEEEEYEDDVYEHLRPCVFASLALFGCELMQQICAFIALPLLSALCSSHTITSSPRHEQHCLHQMPVLSIFYISSSSFCMIQCQKSNFEKLDVFCFLLHIEHHHTNPLINVTSFSLLIQII